MRISMCVCMCRISAQQHMFVQSFPVEKRVKNQGERARGIAAERQVASGSPFNPQMTYLDSFMFAWRRVKKALHFPFYRLGTHVSAALPESALI